MAESNPDDTVRLLYLLLTRLEGYSGATKHVLGLTEAIVRQGIDVRLLCADNRIGASIEGREIISVARGTKRDRSVVPRMLYRAANDPWVRCSGTVIYTRASHFGFVPVLVARKARQPLVVELNGMPEFASIEHATDVVSTSRSERFKLWAAVSMMKVSFSMLFSRGSAFFVNNPEAIEHLVNRRGVDPSKVHMVPLGYDAEHAKPRDMVACRGKLGLPLEGRIVVHVGPLLPYKGAHTLLQAFARIKSKKTTLVFVGEGTFRAQLEKLAHENGVAQSVRFVGAKPFHEAPIWVGASDLAVGLSKVTPLWGCCPTKVIEYVACGVPILTNSMAITRQLAKEMPITLIEDTEDIEELSASLGALMSQDLKSLRVEVLPPAILDYSWDAIGRRAASILASISMHKSGVS